jgi:branched-subunit amino acid aminotransferase/4-amino-4-deoxychorismate lyase
MSQTELYAVTPNGAERLALTKEGASIHELFDDLPLGVYSALRTYEHNQFLGLEDHLDRTDRSMAILGWDYRLDRPALRRALHQACTAYPGSDSRVRFDVLSGPATALGVSSRVLIGLSPFQPVPPAYVVEGVQVAIAPQLHRRRPLVKEAHFVLERRPYPLAQQHAYEHLMLNEDGCLLEGSSSNFYAIRQGTLWTAGADVLEGITRKIILKLAAELGLPVCLEPVALAAVGTLDEAFLSSSSRGLIPIVAVAGQPVGHSRPGPLTRRLIAAYEEYVQAHIRPALAEE